MSKYILFSPIGDHDPIGITKDKKTKEIKAITDGSMAHIVRHYMPEIVVLFLTKEMEEKDKKDNRYEIAIKNIKKDCIIEKLYTGIVEAHDFDQFIELFEENINYIKNKYPDYEILLNVSSGTPQIKSNLLLEVLSNSTKLIPIQVSTPNNGSNKNNDDFKFEYLDKINVEQEEKENRCSEPKILSFKRVQIITQIKSLIKRYEYSAAINILNDSEVKDLFPNDLIRILKHANLRLNLHFDEAQNMYEFENNTRAFIEYFYTMKIKQEKGELSDFVLKIPPLLTHLLTDLVNEQIDFDKIIEIKNDIPYITRAKLEEFDSNLLNYLDEKFKGKEKLGKYRDNFVNTKTLNFILEYIGENYFIHNKKEEQQFLSKKNLLRVFPDIEEKIRNITAHNMISISEGMIQRLCGLTSTKINSKLETALKKIYGYNPDNFVYTKINKKIFEIL